MKPRHKRLVFVGGGLAAASVAAFLVVNAFQNAWVYFYSPSDVLEKQATLDLSRTMRLGGLVKAGSVQRASDGLTVNFVVTDVNHDLPVQFTGILPDLFREGQGVVTEGKLRADGVFHAEQVLAKHDETYMPKEVADALAKGEKVNMEKLSSSLSQ